MKKEVESEICVLCKNITDIPKDMPINQRKNYVEGAGQLCSACYNKLYETGKDKGSGNWGQLLRYLSIW